MMQENWLYSEKAAQSLPKLKPSVLCTNCLHVSDYNYCDTQYDTEQFW